MTGPAGRLLAPFGALVLAAFGVLMLAQRVGDPVLPGGHGRLSSMASGTRLRVIRP